jgi:acyl-CoA thioesterase
MVFEFDEDTEVRKDGPGRFAARVSDRWSIGPVPNGGYVMALALRAVERSVTPPHPLSVTGHFMRPTAPGDVEIQVEVVKAGRRFTTSEARVRSGNRECLRMLVTSGELLGPPQLLRVDATPPLLGPDEMPAVDVPRDALPEIARRFEQRPDPDTSGWLRGDRGGSARVRGWMRFVDGLLPDARSLVLFADAMAPPVFHWVEPTWVPTLELTVHIRALPRSAWLWCDFRTRLAQNGLLEEDGEIWDETKTLVAMSRQLAVLP